MVEVSGVELEIIGVHRYGRILEPDDDLYAVSFCLGAKFQQRMLIETKLSKNSIQTKVPYFRHASILMD
jgi:hypothetical protein